MVINQALDTNGNPLQDAYLGAVLNETPGLSVFTKFGRNPDIDTTSDPEDMWNGGGDYTGFDATADENIEVLSDDANDTGTLVDSGTATDGSSTTLVDSGGNFVADGVAVGDILVNDTQAAHGCITAVTKTTITVFSMVGDEANTTYSNANGDTYRIVNAGDTGAALIKIMKPLDSTFTEQTSQYVILNGLTGVTVTGNYMRANRAMVILAGSSGSNEGLITIRQKTTTANVFAIMPTTGQTTIGAYTIPAGKKAVLKRVRLGLVRASGAAGSATVSVRARRKGEIFRGIRAFEISTADSIDFTQIGGEVLPAGTDIKFRIDQVSDNDTIAEGIFELLMIDA